MKSPHEAYAEALEAANKACYVEMELELNLRDPGNDSYREGHDDGCTDCAFAIRSLPNPYLPPADEKEPT